MAGVAITLDAVALSGGNVANTITTQEYADSDAVYTALAAQTGGGVYVLKVEAGLAADGSSLKKRLIPLTSIKEIVSL